MHPRTVLLALAFVTSCTPQHDVCSAPVRIADLPDVLDETSGIAASRRHPGVLWAHNDSEARSAAALYAIDHDGSLLAQIALPGARTQFDWESIAVGPCGDRDCIYIGDIGDNLHRRTNAAILRLVEPDVRNATVAELERFPIRLPDGPEDAEAMFVTNDGVVYLITKGRRRPVTLYRYPPPLRADETVLLQRVQQLDTALAQLPDMVTGADISADGRRVAIRTYAYVRLYRFDGDTLVPTVALPGVDVTALGERQGEAIAFAGGDTLMLATETGPGGNRPFLSRLTCSMR